MRLGYIRCKYLDRINGNIADLVGLSSGRTVVHDCVGNLRDIVVSDKIVGRFCRRRGHV